MDTLQNHLYEMLKGLLPLLVCTKARSSCLISPSVATNATIWIEFKFVDRGISIPVIDDSFAPTFQIIVYSKIDDGDFVLEDIKEQTIEFSRRTCTTTNRFDAFLLGWLLAVEEKLASMHDTSRLMTLLPCDLARGCLKTLALKTPSTEDDFKRACLTQARLGSL